MTDQEIEKLREKLGGDYSVNRLNGAVSVELADIWKGVEFAECVADVKVDRYGKEIRKGQIYRIVDWFKREVIYIDEDELGWQSKHFKPSSESAYVEQLKGKAHELFGEIKDGDRFDRSEMRFDNQHKNGIVSLSFKGWDYCKKDDKLFFGTICIYQQGKWAKKIERVEVEGSWIHFDDTYLSIKFSFPKKAVTEPSTVAAHLAKCLEDYLNKIP